MQTAEKVITQAVLDWDENFDDGRPMHEFLINRLKAAGWELVYTKKLPQQPTAWEMLRNVHKAIGAYINGERGQEIEKIWKEQEVANTQAEVQKPQTVNEIYPTRSQKWRQVRPLKPKADTILAAMFPNPGPNPSCPHPQAKRVLEDILPDVIERYLYKAQDYRENAQRLGLRGQFADINRKFGKLEAAWWKGQTLTSEQPEEVAQDMVAHLLLSLLFCKDEGAEEEFDDA